MIDVRLQDPIEVDLALNFCIYFVPNNSRERERERERDSDRF